jgi:chemotaxis methyl-accepting protein methylase
VDFDEFLKEVASIFGLQWRPFRRKGVKRKVERRIVEMGLSDFEAYLIRIKKDSGEQNYLSKILTVTISRFFRDRDVFDTIGSLILLTIVRKKGKGDFRIWSIGCANGEEPYSLFLLWKEISERTWPPIHLSILATDIDENLIERAKEGRYKKSSLKEVPEKIIGSHFKIDNGFYVLDQTIRGSVKFENHDIIRDEPFSEMDMVFCRNLAFTYFSKERQIDVLKKIALSLKEKGYLVIGKDESLPLTYPTLFVPVYPIEKVYKKFNLPDSF